MVIRLFAASWVACTAVATVGASCVLDYYLRLGSDVRLLLLVGCVAAVAWVSYRYAYLALGTRLDDLALALKVERRFPQLSDRLASTVQFASATAGAGTGESGAMMRAVVRETDELVARLPLDEVTTAQPLRWVGPVAAALVCAAGVLAVTRPGLTAIGLARLFSPFGATSWPRRTELALVHAPDTVRRGSPYRFTGGVAWGDVPDRIAVHYTFGDGRQSVQQLVPDAHGRIEGRLARADRSFHVALSCPEHRTDAHAVRVVIPPPEPRIEHIQVTLTYPAYTRRGPEELPVGQGKVRAVRGTRVDLAARADLELVDAALHVGRETRPVRIEPDRRHLAAHFTLTDNASYRFRLRTDKTINYHPVVYPVVVVPDRAPTVVFDEPGMDLQVSAEAEIGLVLGVTDDWAVAGVDLVYRVEGRKPDRPVTVELFRDRQKYPKKQVVTHAWGLSPMKLQPGQVVHYWGTAFDYDNVSGPNKGTSRRQYRLQVVSAERLAEIFEQRQVQLRQQIEQVLELQKRVRRGVADLVGVLDAVGQIRRSDIEAMQTTELGQQQVRRKVSHPTDGLSGQVRRLLSEMAFNKFTDADTLTRLREVSRALDGLSRDALPPIGRRLTQVRKGAQATSGKPEADRRRVAPEQRRELTETGQAQQAVITSLEQLLRRFDRWETYREVVRESSDALRDQKALGERTREVGRETLGKRPKQLSGKEKTALTKVARDQEDLERRQRKLEHKMARLAEHLRTTDPLGTDTLREARRQAQESDIAGQMRQAASRLEANQVGSARTSQKQAVAALEKLVHTLRHRREKELAFLLKRLKQAEKDLADLRKKQLALLKKTREADKLKPEQRRRELQRLMKRQRQLEQEIRKFSQRLRRLTAGKASRHVETAAGAMRDASDRLGQAETGGAGAKEEQEALESLDRAAQELAQRRREVAQRLAVEQLVKMEDELRQVHARQKQVLTDTRRLDGLRARRQTLTRAQLRSVVLVSQAQRFVHQDTSALADRLDSAPVFRLVLKRAMSDMDVSAKRLVRRLTDDPTQHAQQRAAVKVARLLEALKPEPQKPAKGAGGGGGGGGGQGGGAPPRVPQVAQLKLLRDMQKDINQRTADLSRKVQADRKLSQDERTELEALGTDQGELADLIRDLTEPKGGP